MKASIKPVFFLTLLLAVILPGVGHSATVFSQHESALPGVYLATAERTSDQASPVCPNTICPGLGNGFYLPASNVLSVQTGGNVFFKNRDLGKCVIESSIQKSVRAFKTDDSMEQFVSDTMSSANLSGSYKTGVLTVSGSAQLVTGSDSSLTTTFHSTHMDIEVATNALDFQQTSDCFAASNVDESFLTTFEALPLFTDPSDSASWAAYIEFLKTQGSHIMMQVQVGSRFQQWESSTSSSSDIENTLKAKACAEVEGAGEGGGWSVNTCAAYSSSEKKSALKQSSTSVSVILGGSSAARAALTAQVNEANLDAFIKSAEQGDEAIRFMFQPIWQLLNLIYSPGCTANGKGSADCDSVQRAANLQAAYEGWLALGCQTDKDGRGSVFQEMQVAGTSMLDINTYRCRASKTGCRSDDDCHLGGAGSVCYCYGPRCIDTGDPINGTTMYRDKVRGNQSGSYDSGVNNSCYYHFLEHCDCDTSWSGGLPARDLYLQSTQ